MADEFRTIRIEDLIDPPLVLREVDQTGVEYAELRDSLRRLGFLNSICVRPCKRAIEKWEIVDGRWRVTAAREVRISLVPSIIKQGLTDKDVLAMQIIANAQRPTTAPTAFARQIKRLLSSKEGMTQAELCRLLNKEPRWVRKMLGVANLAKMKIYRSAIDRGELSLEAAYCLSRLPQFFWSQFFTDACVRPLREFRSTLMTTLREYRAQIYAGKLNLRNNTPIKTQPFLRTLTEIISEIENGRIGPLQIAAHGYATPMAGWKAALEWMAHLDPESCERQRRVILKRLKKRLVTRLKNT